MPDLFQAQTNLKTKDNFLLEPNQPVDGFYNDESFLSVTLKAKQVLPQIDWVTTHRKIEFLANLLGLQRHSSVQVRRKTAFSIGLLGNKEILEDLKRWQIHESDRETWLILEATIDKLLRKIDGHEVKPSIQVLSVSEAISQVKNLISEKKYIIEGELSEVKAVRQMFYFSLKDKEDTNLDCSAFVGKIIKAGFPMNEGLMVRVSGKFKLSKFSKIFFDVEKIELTGEGELLRNFLLLKEKLEKEGYFDHNRKRKLKKLPKRILLLTSPVSAALSDFTTVLKNRIGGITIYFLPIKTQGVGAELELLEKLEIANKVCLENQIDTVVITRGGGSKDDLWMFNSEKVVKKIYTLISPTIVAIGHERDTTLAELVADMRASTPSQAAELVSISKAQVLAELNAYEHFLNSFFLQRKADYQKTSNQLYQIILYKTREKLDKAKEICRNIDSEVLKLLNKLKYEAKISYESIFKNIQEKLFETRYNLLDLKYIFLNLENQIFNKQNLVKDTYLNIKRKVKQDLEAKKYQLELDYSKIQAFDVQKILDKGFAIVWQNGEILDSYKKYKKSKDLRIQFRDGNLEIIRE